MQKVRVSVLILWALCFSGNLITPEPVKLSWLTLQEAEAANRLNEKPILIDLYTDWCGWCKVMDKKTYTNRHVIEYINKNFYPVKLDAETKGTVEWSGRRYVYNVSNRVNDIATYLTSGRLAFPSTVFIPTRDGEPQVVPGYLTPRQLEVVLKYVVESGKDVSFEDFRKRFKASW